jgi:hypothetical protein
MLTARGGLQVGVGEAHRVDGRAEGRVVDQHVEAPAGCVGGLPRERAQLVRGASEIGSDEDG